MRPLSRVMGSVDARLVRLFASVKPEVALPVIVSTNRAPDQGMLQRAVGVGASQPRLVSQLGNIYATTATVNVASALAGLPETLGVYYDEPVVALGAGG